MALRIRKDGRILCAAMHPAEPGDCYIDDHHHYEMSVALGVIVTEPMDAGGKGGHLQHGEWWWTSHVPAGATPDLTFASTRSPSEGQVA